jgi:hypothetical protein
MDTNTMSPEDLMRANRTRYASPTALGPSRGGPVEDGGTGEGGASGAVRSATLATTASCLILLSQNATACVLISEGQSSFEEHGRGSIGSPVLISSHDLEV